MNVIRQAVEADLDTDAARRAGRGSLVRAARRGLTPLFWQHVRPYGEVRLDMGARLRIGEPG